MSKSWIAALSLLLLSGCASFTLEPPPDFLVLEDRPWTGYALRATSADGVVLGVREVADEREGTLAFWTEAIRERLRADRGYALLAEERASAATGQEGVRLRFGRDEGSQPYAYWVTLFLAPPGLLQPARLLIVEAGGKKAEFEAQEAALGKAIASLAIH